MKTKSCLFLLVIVCMFASFPKYLFAVGSSGIENASFSAKSLAQSNAVVAQADEPAAISYNPAGIVDLPGFQLQQNLSYISAFTFFEGGEAASGGNGSTMRSSATLAPVPTGYLTLNAGDFFDGRVAFGIGSDSPFGLINKYDSQHPTVRLAGARNWLYMYTIKPTLAVKLADWLAIGAGPMYYRIYDWGGIQAYPNALGEGAGEGQVRLNLSGNHWGWQAGILAKPHWRHQFGFYFRSPVVVNTSGLAKVERSAFSGNFETGAYAKYTLPLNFTWGYAFRPNGKSTVEFDFGYTRWSTYERLFIDHVFVSTKDADVINGIGRNAKDWRDSFSWHLGGNYQVTDNLTLMGGSFFYTFAGANDSFIPATPDGHRLGVSTGASYKVHKNVALDVMYLNVWNLKRSINNSIGNLLGTSVEGDWMTYTQEFTISVRFAWDNFVEDVVKKGIPFKAAPEK